MRILLLAMVFLFGCNKIPLKKSRRTTDTQPQDKTVVATDTGYEVEDRNVESSAGTHETTQTENADIEEDYTRSDTQTETDNNSTNQSHECTPKANKHPWLGTINDGKSRCFVTHIGNGRVLTSWTCFSKLEEKATVTFSDCIIDHEVTKNTGPELKNNIFLNGEKDLIEIQLLKTPSDSIAIDNLDIRERFLSATLARTRRNRGTYVSPFEVLQATPVEKVNVRHFYGLDDSEVIIRDPDTYGVCLESGAPFVRKTEGGYNLVGMVSRPLKNDRGCSAEVIVSLVVQVENNN